MAILQFWMTCGGKSSADTTDSKTCVTWIIYTLFFSHQKYRFVGILEHGVIVHFDYVATANYFQTKKSLLDMCHSVEFLSTIEIKNPDRIDVVTHLNSHVWV